MAHLTPFAKAHMRLVGIDRRFEEVIGRNPHIHDGDKKDNWGTVADARRRGEVANDCFENDMKLFDQLVHGRAN